MRLEDADLVDLAFLALKDRAFAVYEEMEEGDKMDFEKIAVALMTAFAEDPISAHIAFVDRKYVTGEGVDSYLNQLKKLGRIAGGQARCPSSSGSLPAYRPTSGSV